MPSHSLKWPASIFQFSTIQTYVTFLFFNRFRLGLHQSVWFDKRVLHMLTIHSKTVKDNKSDNTTDVSQLISFSLLLAFPANLSITGNKKQHLFLKMLHCCCF